MCLTYPIADTRCFSSCRHRQLLSTELRLMLTSPKQTAAAGKHSGSGSTAGRSLSRLLVVSNQNTCVLRRNKQLESDDRVDAAGYESWATHAVGVTSGRRWIGRSANPRSIDIP